MSEFASKTVAAVNHFPVNYNAATHTSSERNHDEVFHSSRHTVGHLAQGSGVCVVGHTARNSESFCKELTDRYHAFPNKIGGVFYRAVVVVAIGSADAHRFDFANAANFLNNGLESLDGSGYIVVDIGIGFGADSGLRNDVAALVHNAKDAVGSAHVQSDDVGLCWCSIFHKVN